MEKDSEEDKEWLAECSDEELYNYSGEKGVWQLSPPEILSLYEKLAKGETLELEWKCGERRSPSPEQVPVVEEVVPVVEEKPEEVKVSVPEFDFDEVKEEERIITPRRTPGSSKAPRSAQRRVASMDKIMGDILRRRKMDNKDRNTGTPHRPVTKVSPKKI
ncbi:hypothetical protein NP493_1576g00018 [Ridgeia piscesae]|uniref:PAXIP1-associated glutamate-rich protein 1 n=1 Tax=Ridgeia piscesae TaxID=27915 RepID=A0AAD9NAL1_RIDPI|nr:hypothetical protein NP493_1576g00018 [Ridgeia piscesae]